MEALFIFHDSRSGIPLRNASGGFDTGGALGYPVGLDHPAFRNVQTHAPSDFSALAVGGCVPNVSFRCSGVTALYDVYRVA